MTSIQNVDTALADGRNTDIVILAMGAPKSGKSSFLNRLVGSQVFKVGSRLASCTDAVCSHVLASAPPSHDSLNHALQGRRVVLVDTPGFDVTRFERSHTPTLGDEEVLGRVSEWLAASCKRGMKIGGVIYCHDISQDGVTDSSRRLNLNAFSKICGDRAMDRVRFVTTKWDRTDFVEGRTRVVELKDSSWREMLDLGASTYDVQPEEHGDSLPAEFQRPWDIIHEIVVSMNARAVHDGILRLQEELVLGKRYLPDTDAGRALNMSLESLSRAALELRGLMRADAMAGKRVDSLRKRQEEIDKLMGQLKAVRLPKFVVRGLQLFGKLPRSLGYF